MTQCNTKTRLHFQSQLPVDIEFSADDISSDGGAILLRQAEDKLGICEAIAELVPDGRDPGRVVHSRQEQVLQRVLQIALGYADQNDADWLRDDPILKTACGGAPNARALSAQPTLSRLENAPTAAHVEAMQWKLIFSWIRGLDRERREVTLDIDASAFEGHGTQQELSFCGFHRCYMLHPLFVFDDETGQLITVILRPGNAHDARDAVEWIERIVVLLKTLHRDDCSIVVRADSGFGNPGIYERLEELDRTFGDIGYLIGMARNSVLQSHLEPALEQARRRRLATGRPARVFVDFDYQAGSWHKPRHIVGKAEVTLLGDNPRFVVTNLGEFPARLLYEVGYCGRGRCEQYIGEFKGALQGDRISCHTFEANGFRLILHALAYRLLFEIRRTIGEEAGESGTGKQLAQLARASFATLRLRLLKVAFVVRQSVRRIFLQGARSFPKADAFHHVAAAMG